MKDSEVGAIVAEKSSTTRQRAMLESRVVKLRGCREELKKVLGAPRAG